MRKGESLVNNNFIMYFYLENGRKNHEENIVIPFSLNPDGRQMINSITEWKIYK